MKVKNILLTPLLLLAVAMTAASCNEVEKNYPIDISTNLLQNGSADPALLIGEWDIVKFAHTTDGKKIVDVTVISRGWLHVLSIADKDSIECKHSVEDMQWNIFHTNWSRFICSLSGNSITFSLCGSTFAMPTPEEITILEALENSYSFVVRDDELILYFTGIENTNLLIFKKRKS